MSLRNALDRFLSRSETDHQPSAPQKLFNVQEDLVCEPNETVEELILTPSQVCMDPVKRQRVAEDDNMYANALRQKEQALLVAKELLGREPNLEKQEDRMVLLFSAVQQVGCHVEYVGEITGLDYGYVQRVMQRMHKAGIWPPIGTVDQPIPMTAEQCADLSIICDEGLHGKGPRSAEIRKEIPTHGMRGQSETD